MNFPLAPLTLGLILGGTADINFRQSLTMSGSVLNRVVGDILLRWLLLPIDILLFGSVAAFSMLVTPRRQRVGDLAAGTMVIRLNSYDQMRVSLDEFRRAMEGIYSTSVCAETIDESPMAYKPMQEIVSQIADTVDVVDVIKPIYNFKAKTPEKPDWKALKHKLPKAE